jgi:hypothetical protein
MSQGEKQLLRRPVPTRRRLRLNGFVPFTLRRRLGLRIARGHLRRHFLTKWRFLAGGLAEASQEAAVSQVPELVGIGAAQYQFEVRPQIRPWRTLSLCRRSRVERDPSGRFWELATCGRRAHCEPLV